MQGVRHKRQDFVSADDVIELTAVKTEEKAKDVLCSALANDEFAKGLKLPPPMSADIDLNGRCFLFSATKTGQITRRYLFLCVTSRASDAFRAKRGRSTEQKWLKTKASSSNDRNCASSAPRARVSP